MHVRTLLALGIGGFAALVATVFGLARQVGVKSYGSPVGRVVRAGEHLAVLMETRDPYMPSLKGRAERDMSYSYQLWLIPESGKSDTRKVTLDRHVQSADRSTFAGVLGSVSGVVWFRIADLQGVDIASGRRVATAPPSSISNMPISEFLGSTSQPVIGPYRTTCVEFGPGSWLVLSDTEEAPAELKVGKQLSHNNTSKGTYLDRSLYAVTAQPGPRLATSTRLGSLNLHNAAFMRTAPNADIVRFSNPDGVLVVYEEGQGAVRTIHFARVNLDGTIAWTADTRMGGLNEVLPHDSVPVFVGELENKLSQPMVSVLHLSDGTIQNHSLQGPLN